MKVAVSIEKCKRCGTCAAACPEAIFAQQDPSAPPEVIREDLCISCGHCVALCPNGAISHTAFPEGKVPPIDTGLLPATAQVLELLRARRSARVFLDAPVPKALLEQIVEAAHLAPSAHNLQTTEYLVVQDGVVLRGITEMTIAFLDRTRKQLRNPIIRFLFGLVERNELRGAFPLLPDFDMVVEAFAQGRDPILRGAPCLVLFHADPGTSYPDKNAQLALANATMMAQTLGLGSFYAGYVVGACERDRRIRQLLCIPKGRRVYAGLALGYPKFKFARWIRRMPPKVVWR